MLSTSPYLFLAFSFDIFIIMLCLFCIFLASHLSTLSYLFYLYCCILLSFIFYSLYYGSYCFCVSPVHITFPFALPPWFLSLLLTFALFFLFLLPPVVFTSVLSFISCSPFPLLLPNSAYSPVFRTPPVCFPFHFLAVLLLSLPSLFILLVSFFVLFIVHRSCVPISRFHALRICITFNILLPVNSLSFVFRPVNLLVLHSFARPYTLLLMSLYYFPVCILH